MPKNCIKGKNCGGTCIENVDVCRLLLGEREGKALDSLQKKCGETLSSSFGKIDQIKTEEEAIDWLSKNYKNLASEGMDEFGVYGGPGQRGSLDSKVWFMGQEGYSRPKTLFPEKDDMEIDEILRKDPVAAINSIKVQSELYKSLPEYKGNPDWQSKVEDYFLTGEIDPKVKNYATVENWSSNDAKTYYGVGGRLAKTLGIEGNLAGMNVSSFMMPSEQKTLTAVSKMLKSKGIDPKTFAEGAFSSKSSWYKYSAKSRFDYFVDALNKGKPKMVYMGQQSPVDSKSAMNLFLYNLARGTGNKVFHTKVDGKDYKWTVVGGSVIINGFHFTSKPKNTDKKFLESLSKSLITTGKPPEGVDYQEVSSSIIDRVLQ